MKPFIQYMKWTLCGKDSFCISGDNLLYDRASAFSVFAFIRGDQRSRSQCGRSVECEASLFKKTPADKKRICLYQGKS